MAEAKKGPTEETRPVDTLSSLPEFSTYREVKVDTDENPPPGRMVEQELGQPGGKSS
jgi:hypothetical protein